MHSFLKRFLKARRGNVAIEFALILPLYLLIFSGLFEITMYAFLQNKLQRFGSVMADAVGRQNMTRDTLQKYLLQSATFVTPFDFSKGRITISQIHNEGETDDPGNMIIGWQESFQGDASQIGSSGEAPQTLPNNLELLYDQAVIMAEVAYDYQSLIFGSFIGEKTLYISYMTPPRGENMNVLLGE